MRSQETARMEDALSIAASIGPPLTISFRAEHLLNSRRDIMQEMMKIPEAAITIWSSRDEFKGKNEWPKIFIQKFGEDVFLDLINKKLEPLHSKLEYKQF